MKTIVLSDIHGELIDIQDKFDLMLICGDICPVECHAKRYQNEWINYEFVDWINNLPFNDDNSKVIMIPGNHDFIFDGIVDLELKEWLNKFNHRLVYLDNSEYEYIFEDRVYKIFGTPYCKPFGNWAFMREDMKKYYDMIPKDTDILISHDAADINNLGMIEEGKWRGTNAGNIVLAKYIKDIKPKYYFCGHIHSGTHKFDEIDGTKMANVSIMNEHYYPINSPLIIDIE